jgi:hypothetical protein
VAGTGRRCLLVIIGGGITSLVRQRLSAGSPHGDGGDRWVAHTGVAGHGRAGHLRRLSSSG